MTALIRKNGHTLGELTFAGTTPIFSGTDRDLAALLDIAELPVTKDIYDSHEKKFTMMQATVSRGHELFPVAITQYLKRHGYETSEYHPETQNAIRALLETFPDDNEDKQYFLSRLSDMSRLEQTLLLRELSKLDASTER